MEPLFDPPADAPDDPVGALVDAVGVRGADVLFWDAAGFEDLLLLGC